MRKRFQIILSLSLLVFITIGFVVFTHMARQYIYQEVVDQAIEDNQVIAEQLVKIIGDYYLANQSDTATLNYLRTICKEIQLPNNGFLCAINPSGDVIAGPPPTGDMPMNFSKARLENLKQDTTFEMRTLRAKESFQGYMTLQNNRMDVVVSMPLAHNANRILVHQNHEAIAQRAQKYTRPLLTIGIIVALALAILTYFATDRIITGYQFRIEKKNKELQSAYSSIMEKNEEIATQNDELQQQRDIATEQRDLIAGQKLAITQSIEYARYIQQAVLPDKRLLKNTFPGCFLFFRPRDIVSGDFYWFHQQGSLFYIVAADCTGHGVPGAFMSLLGTTFLNEVVIDKQVAVASDVLEQLRSAIIQALNQNKEHAKASDGMDMSLCIVDTDKKEWQFAGANNPLYYLSNGQLEVIKGDKQPVGISDTMQPFTNHSHAYAAGDRLYLFSDGYADQFGGPKDRKFKYSRLRQLLRESSQVSVEEQGKILAKAFDDWKGSTFQVDDVLVMGVAL